MNTILKIILIIILVIIIVVFIKRLGIWPFAKARQIIIIGKGDVDNSLKLKYEKVEKKITKYINGVFKAKTALKCNSMLTDKNSEIYKSDTDITPKKIKYMDYSNLNSSVSKIILNTLVFAFIYEKQPNKPSNLVINNNIKLLKNVLQSDNLYFKQIDIENLIKECQILLKTYQNKEIKYKPLELTDYFRSAKLYDILDKSPDFTTLANQKEFNNLKDELHRKNIELKETKDSLDRSKYSTSSLSAMGTLAAIEKNYLLENCEKDKRLLQEKVYELKKDIERLKINSNNNYIDPYELQNLRAKVQSLQNDNANLNNDIRQCRLQHDARENDIRTLTQELNECHMIVNALNA